MISKFVAIPVNHRFIFFSLDGQKLHFNRKLNILNSYDKTKIYFISNDTESILGEIEKNTLTLLITTLCNQNCIMCPQRLNDDSIDHDKALSIVISKLYLLKCNEIYLTGGEPFLKSSIIDNIFINTKRNIKIIILTNGSILPSNIVLNSNRVTLCIPLYSNTDTIHNNMTMSKNFYLVINNLIIISAYKIPIELRFVITKENYKILPVFSEFIYRNLPFVSNIAFMGIELMEHGAINAEKMWIDPNIFSSYLYKALDFLLALDMPVSIYNIPHCQVVQKYHSLIYKSISERKRKDFSFCYDCKYKKDCGGFFESDIHYYKEIIKEPCL